MHVIGVLLLAANLVLLSGSCEMPAAVPPDLRNYVQQRVWNAFRRRQMQQIRKTGGCKRTEVENGECTIEQTEVVELTGDCRVVFGRPTCIAVVPPVYGDGGSLEVSNHWACAGMVTVPRPSNQPHHSNHHWTAQQIQAAILRAKRRRPVHAGTNPMVTCTVTREITRLVNGTCSLVGVGGRPKAYSCRSLDGGITQWHHTDCSYLLDE